MLINAEEAVLVEDDEDLAASIIGGPWTLFKQSIPEPQAKILVQAFNLILLADTTAGKEDELDPDALLGHPTSMLPVDVNNLLVDDAVSLVNKKAHIYEMLIDNTMYLLRNLGFTLDEDYVTAEMLPYLCKIGHFFYEMQGYQDLIGIAGALESPDIPTVDRFLLVLERYLGEDADMTPYEMLISDVSEVCLKAIKDSLEGEDVSVGIPDSLIQRVKANLLVLEGTLAYNHIRSNGQLGGSLDSFLNFFHKELRPLQDELTGDNVHAYVKELIGFYLISDVNSSQIKERLLTTTYELTDDHLTMVKVESLINQLVFPNE
jgi:hypothetical protein